MEPSSPACPNSQAATAVPAKYMIMVGLRPIFSMRYAALKYPGSWAKHIITVNSNPRTISNPLSISRDGVQSTNP